MKKQLLLLFLALLTLAVPRVYAQGPYLPPTPLHENCLDLDNPLTPVPGRAYTYRVNVPSPNGEKTYHWFVTQDTLFIENGGIIATPEQRETSTILASGSAYYNTPSVGDEHNEIELTFQSFTLENDEYVFVVIYVVNDDEDGCITDNLKVYRIQPLHAFTLTIANIDGGAIDPGMTEICVDDVQSARFDPDHGVNGGVVYDYGQNEFYYAVAAANFSGDFRLAATFSGLQGATPDGNAEQLATIYWGTSLADVQAATTGGVGITDAITELGVISPPAGSYGEGALETDEDAAFMLYIKVVVEHREFEAANADGYEYTLALDAILPDAGGLYGDHDNDNPLGDLDNLANVLADCGRNAFGEHNWATQLLLPRPTITPVDPDEFLPNAPENP